MFFVELLKSLCSLVFLRYGFGMYVNRMVCDERCLE